MNQYDASEMAYKNGFEKGFSSGEYEAVRKFLMYIETQMEDQTSCSCGRAKMSRFYNYCPYCGEKY